MNTTRELSNSAFDAMLVAARIKQGLMRDRMFNAMLADAKKTWTGRFEALPTDATEREFRVRLVSQQAGGQVNGETTYWHKPANAQPFSREAIEDALARNAWVPTRASLALIRYND